MPKKYQNAKSSKNVQQQNSSKYTANVKKYQTFKETTKKTKRRQKKVPQKSKKVSLDQNNHTNI